MKRRRNATETAMSADTSAAAVQPPTNDDGAALALNAADVRNVRFHTARKGYHKGEVDDFLDRVEAAIDAKNARIAELESLGSAQIASPTNVHAAVAAPVTTVAEPVAEPVTAAPMTYEQPMAAAVPVAAAEAPDAASGDGAFPPGWYADPWDVATYRYYDGGDWTAQTR